MVGKPKVVVLHEDRQLVDTVAQLAAARGCDVVQIRSHEELDLNRDAILVVVDEARAKRECESLLETISKFENEPGVVVAGSDPGKLSVAVGRSRSDLFPILTGPLRDAQLARIISVLLIGDAELFADDLRLCLDHGLLVVEFQPKVPLSPAAAEDFEVETLSRIRHPRLGTIAPAQFIALAERSGLIGDLTDVVLQRAFTAWQLWASSGLFLRLAINISPELLADNVFADGLLKRCAEFEIPHDRVILELTESSSSAASDGALDILSRLRLKGVSLAIDDFGTGYSSLTALYRIPFSELKIDRSFTIDLCGSESALAVVESTIDLGRRMGLSVTAEGVENQATLDELRRLGCDRGQGRFISEPLRATDVLKFFGRWSADNAIDALGVVPKIKAIQAMLDAVVGDIATDKTVVLSRTHTPESRASDPLERLTRVPSLVLQGDNVAALAACHDSSKWLMRQPGRSDLMNRIADLRRSLEQEMLIQGEVELVGTSTVIRPIPGRNVLIGRPSSTRAVDVAINCRWFSRGERSLYLFTEGREWFIEDLGSANGSFIGGTRLQINRRYVLSKGETIVEIGRSSDQVAPVVVRLFRGGPDAVVISVRPGGAFEDPDHETWPTLRDDLQKRWVVFRNDCPLGASEYEAVAATPETAMAVLSYHNGLWIAPAQSHTLRVNAHIFRDRVPVCDDAELSFGTLKLKVRKLAASRITDTEDRQVGHG
jgi:EAL domain-containing protein (putative c-di-GMP-specific phosphodiesterase class I)